MDTLIFIPLTILIIGLIVLVTEALQKKVSFKDANRAGITNSIFGYYMRKIDIETNFYGIFEGTLGITETDLSFTHRFKGETSLISTAVSDIQRFEQSNEYESDYRKDYLTEKHDMATFIMQGPSQRLIGNIGGSFVRRPLASAVIFVRI